MGIAAAIKAAGGHEIAELVSPARRMIASRASSCDRRWPETAARANRKLRASALADHPLPHALHD